VVFGVIFWMPCIVLGNGQRERELGAPETTHSRDT